MVAATDYQDLDSVGHHEGAEVVVMSSGFVYRSMKGRWLFVRRQPMSRRCGQSSSQLVLDLFNNN